MGLRETYARFFAPTPKDAGKEAEALGWAENCGAFWDGPYLQSLIARLRRKVEEPITLDGDIIARVATQNSYRDLILMLESDYARAKRIIARAQAESQER